ncbi:MAG: DUF4383 domain-containing protein [Burkholderiales bacterium]
MTARTFAAVCGGLYLVLGLMGFVPALWERPPAGPPITVRVFHASLLGVFVVNIVLSMVHLVIGLWGTMAANNRYSALMFARASCAVFAVLGIAGLIPINEVRTVYGTLPLFGNNAWLHLGTAVLALIFGIWPGYTLTNVGVREAINPHAPTK